MQISLPIEICFQRVFLNFRPPQGGILLKNFFKSLVESVSIGSEINVFQYDRHYLPFLSNCQTLWKQCSILICIFGGKRLLYI